MNIDWIEGATHYGIGDDCPVFFRNIIKGESYEFKNVYSSGIMANWLKCTGYIDIPKGLVERPKKQEAWDSGDLPPVGITCEVRDDDDNCWVVVDVYAHTEFKGDTYACAKNESDMFYGLAHEFRPIKTAEQLAEEKREDAANKMFQQFGGIGGLTKKQCIWVISEGYRKQ